VAGQAGPDPGVVDERVEPVMAIGHARGHLVHLVERGEVGGLPVEVLVPGAPRLVADPELKGVTGRYFDGESEARAHPQAYDDDARRRLRELSKRLAGL